MKFNILILFVLYGHCMSALGADPSATNQPGSNTKIISPRPPKKTEFRGEILAIDKAAGTIKLQSLSPSLRRGTNASPIRTFAFNSETRFSQGTQLATVDNLVVGDRVSYEIRPVNREMILLTAVDILKAPPTKPALNY